MHWYPNGTNFGTKKNCPFKKADGSWDDSISCKSSTVMNYYICRMQSSSSTVRTKHILSSTTPITHTRVASHTSSQVFYDIYYQTNDGQSTAISQNAGTTKASNQQTSSIEVNKSFTLGYQSDVENCTVPWLNKTELILSTTEAISIEDEMLSSQTMIKAVTSTYNPDAVTTELHRQTGMTSSASIKEGFTTESQIQNIVKSQLYEALKAKHVTACSLCRNKKVISL